MVTAIVIPLIIIYFFIITKKEIRLHTEKWLALENVSEEAVVVGKVQNINERNERFYYHRYIHVLELTLINNQKRTVVFRVTPMYNGRSISHPFEIGDYIRVYGNWKECHFQFMRFERL